MAVGENIKDLMLTTQPDQLSLLISLADKSAVPVRNRRIVRGEPCGKLPSYGAKIR
jgi:hypothetical protein